MTLADSGPGEASGIVDRYRAAHLVGLADRPASADTDELLDPAGAIRTGWQDLAATVDLLGTQGLQARGAQIRRLLEDDGVTYGAPLDADQPAALWQLDPLPLIIGSREWAELSPGL